jgi:hypothetical protein
MREAYDAAMDEFVSLIHTTQPDLEARFERILIDQPQQFRRIVLKAVPASSTLKSQIILEPSDLLLELLSAVRANDRDRLIVIERHMKTSSLSPALEM